MTITEAHIVSAKVPAQPGAQPLPAHCRVIAVSRPTADSEIRLEVLLPLADAWNGRYLQRGNGAFAGRIPEGDLMEGLALGYAVAGTDDGHQAKPGEVSWALGHPDKVVDFGYRAVKETNDAARRILHAFTGRDPKFSYFDGCSEGGREALVEAQRYPEDFDGIVAGAPPIDTTRVLFGFAWNVRAMLETPGSYVRREKLDAIEAAALQACGDADGVIEDPMHCRFDPSVLRCMGAETDRCLTDPEIAALRKVYAGPVNPRTGARIAPGFEPGGEAEERPDGWTLWIAGPLEDGTRSGDFLLANNFFRYMVFGDPSYDLGRLDFDADVATTDAKIAPILNASNPDLTRLRNRRGRLIHWHGWNDAIVPPRMSIGYYERVRATMGDASDVYRLFMAPGMTHCQGGRGPNVLATLTAITDWVERGIAPDSLLAAKYVDDSKARPVERTRPVCAYPRRAEWDGKGDPKRAGSYRCTGG